MKTILPSLFLLGILIMLGVAVLNSYIAFFVHGDYTAGMFFASAFWFLAGWTFFYHSLNTRP